VQGTPVNDLSSEGKRKEGTLIKSFLARRPSLKREVNLNGRSRVPRRKIGN